MPIVLGLGTSLFYAPGFFQAATVGRWAILSVVLAWIWQQPKLSLGHVMLLCWLAYASLSLLWTPDLPNGFQHIWYLAILWLGFCLGAQMTSLRSLTFWIGVGLCLNLVLVLVQMVGWSPVWQGPSPAGLFFNKNYLAESAALICILAFTTHLRWIGLAMIGILALTWCREADLAVVIAALVWLWPKAPKITLELAVLLLGAAILWLNPTTLGFRAIMWQDSLAHLAPFGHGIGSFYSLYPAFGHFTDGRPEYPHNELIYSLFEIGPAVVFPLGLAIWAWGSKKSRPALAGIATICTFGFPLQLPLSLLIISLTLGHSARGRNLAWSEFFSGREAVTNVA